MKKAVLCAMPAVFWIMFSQGCATKAPSDNMESAQKPFSFKQEIRKTVNTDYLLHLPEAYGTPGEKWPLLLFLHGAGERGNDLEMVVKHGPPRRIDEGNWDLPCIVVSPQCPEDAWWTDTQQIDTLNALIDHIVAAYSVDEDRIYLTGLSMGGFGTWKLASEYPDRFAAIVPVCGGGDPFQARKIKRIPAWVFHGAKDDVVPLEASERMVNALKKAGGTVEFTVYPEAGHDSWTETYNNPDLYDWLFRQNRSKNK